MSRALSAVSLLIASVFAANVAVADSGMYTRVSVGYTNLPNQFGGSDGRNTIVETTEEHGFRLGGAVGYKSPSHVGLS